MNLAFVDLEKNLNDVVALYKKYKDTNKVKIIKDATI